MNSAKVSIIIPVYNGANFLESAIESALNQTYSNVEVIVVNDGSTDHGQTKEIAERYLGRIKYFEKENGGVASALNLGLSQMSGEYFSWLSHDDFFHPDKIQKSIEAISTGTSRCIVITDFWIDDVKNSYKSRSRPLKSIPGMLSYNEEEYQYALIRAFFESRLHMCSTLIPAHAIKNIGDFNEGLVTTQDYDFFLRLAEADYRFIILDEPLLTTRHHDLQDTKTKNTLHIRELNSLYLSIFDRFKPVLQGLPIRLYFGLVDMMYARGLEAVCFHMLNSVTPPRDEPQTTIWLYWENREGARTPEYIYQCWYSVILRNKQDFAITIVTPETLNKYLPNLNNKYLGFNEIAHRADYIRFNLLREHGGIWLDSDFVSFRSLKPIKDLLSQKGFACCGYQDAGGKVFPIISFLASSKNHPVVCSMVEAIDRFIEGPLSLNGKQPLWDEIGGDNLKNILLVEKEYHLIDIKSFYPIPTHSTKQIIRDEGIRFDFETLAYGQNISHSDFGEKISRLSKRELFDPSTILGRVFLMGLSDISVSLITNSGIFSMSIFWRLLSSCKRTLKKSPFVWKLLNSAKTAFYGFRYK